jgi:hypothetical protein
MSKGMVLINGFAEDKEGYKCLVQLTPHKDIETDPKKIRYPNVKFLEWKLGVPEAGGLSKPEPDNDPLY